MAKKSKQAAAEKPAPKSKRGKKAAEVPQADTPETSVDPAAETIVDAPAVKVEPAPKRKGRKKDAPPEPPPETEAAAEPTPEPGDTTSELPAVESETPPAEVEVPAPVNFDELARTVEALLFAAEEPLQPRELGRCSGSDSATIRKLIPKIKERYDSERRPWDIVETGTGFRLVTRPEFYPAIQRLKTQTMQRKLTQAGLETLALIAYRQPISRAEVENVRGVGAGPVLRQLLERKLIKISGRGTGLGQPLLYGTTDYFLEHFGLTNIAELPKPGELKQ